MTFHLSLYLHRCHAVSLKKTKQFPCFDKVIGLKKKTGHYSGLRIGRSNKSGSTTLSYPEHNFLSSASLRNFSVTTMGGWNLANCINLFVLTVIFVSGEKVAKHNSCKKVLGQEASSLTVAQISNVSSKARYEVCADIFGVIFYCPGDEICCTPGDPFSKCCPADYPLCLPVENPEKCCPVGYPKLCGSYCCEVGSFCCNEKICCENEGACCGAQCCEDGEFCCNGLSCCDSGDSCCGVKCCDVGEFCCNGINCCDSVGVCCGAQCCDVGEFCCNGISCCDSVDACCGAQCCPEDASCCKQDGSSACCDKVTMGCCDGYGCVPPCPSQFDAIGCQLSSLSLDDKLLEAPYGLPTNVYRLLRPDENPDGIVAKNPGAQKSVLSHVNCGSRPKYASQFISTSASLDVAKDYKKKGEEKGITGLRICEFEVDKLPQTCQIVDLTTEENRDKYLGNAVCKAYAKASAEVLLQCGVPIPCTVIDPPNRA